MDANGHAPALGLAAVSVYMLAGHCGATAGELGAFARQGLRAPAPAALAASPHGYVTGVSGPLRPTPQQLFDAAGQEWYQEFVLNRTASEGDVAVIANGLLGRTVMDAQLRALGEMLRRRGPALAAVRGEVAGLRAHETTPPAVVRAVREALDELLPSLEDPNANKGRPSTADAEEEEELPGAFVAFLAAHLGDALAFYFPRLRQHAEALAVLAAVSGRVVKTAGPPHRRITAVAIV